MKDVKTTDRGPLLLRGSEGIVIRTEDGVVVRQREDQLVLKGFFILDIR